MAGPGGSADLGAPLPNPATWSLGTWVVVAALVGLVFYRIAADLSVLEATARGTYFFLGVMGLGVGLVAWKRLTRYFDEHPGRPEF